MTERADQLDAPTSDLHSSAGLASALGIATMRLARRLRVERTDETLGLTQLSALASLDRYGPLSPTALAEQERVQPPSMTRVIAALEGRGFVEREAHPSDRRQSVIAITGSGKRLVEEDRKRRQAWLARLIDELDDSQRAHLIEVVPILQRLAEA
jgi:DNA-binding MarR family transcriptional regulator